MESKDWSGFGYFSPVLEKKNLRQLKETEFSTPFFVKAATSLLLNSLKFTWKALTFFVANLVDFKTLKRRPMNPETGV